MNAPRCALLWFLVCQGCLLEDGRTPSDDAGLDTKGSGGSIGSGGSVGSDAATGIDGAPGGSGGSSAGAAGATTGTGGSATGGAAGATTGTGGAGTGGTSGTGGAGGSAGTGKGGTSGTGGSGTAGTGGSIVDSGADIRTIDIADVGIIDVAMPDRSGGDACTSPLDTDGDGTPDCADGCPRDAKKTSPGACGCGMPDSTGSDGGPLGCLRAALVHRYSFNGGGGDAASTVATDSVGTAHGTVQGGANATLANGTLALSGDRGTGYTSEGFVSLPVDVLNGLTSVTLEVWVTWRGAAGGTGAAWQRIFDFGDQQASGSNQNGRTYLFLTPSSGSNTLRMAWSSNGTANETIVEQSALPTGMLKHVAVVIDDAGGSASLCVDGTCATSAPLATGALGLLTRTNNWLGRSNFSVDPELNGILHEFRVYNAPLAPSLVSASFAAGPDVAF